MTSTINANKPTGILISASKQKKAAIVADISEKVQKAKGFIFTNYQGLTHRQLEAIKRAVKKVDAEYVATKNTLLTRALKEGNVNTDTTFKGPTATLFIYNDPLTPLKELAKSIKSLNLPIIKFGIVDGKVFDASEIERLSSLPPVNVLRAQLAGQLQSPISRLHRALSWNLARLVLTVNAIKVGKMV